MWKYDFKPKNVKYVKKEPVYFLINGDEYYILPFRLNKM